MLTETQSPIVTAPRHALQHTLFRVIDYCVGQPRAFWSLTPWDGEATVCRAVLRFAADTPVFQSSGGHIVLIEDREFTPNLLVYAFRCGHLPYEVLDAEAWEREAGNVGGSGELT